MSTFATRETRQMGLEDLDPAPYNPRDRLSPESDAYWKLRESLLKFGNVQPIVVNVRDGQNTIVGGHQRYWILKDDLGETEDTVVVVDLEPKFEKALNLALNNPAGSFNVPRLEELIDGIRNYDDGDYIFALTQMSDDTASVLSRVDAIQAAQEADFLVKDMDIDQAVTEMPSVGAPELKGDHPHRTGEQYFNMQLVFTSEQRATVFSAIDEAKKVYGLGTTMEAIVAICTQFLLDQGVDHDQ